MSHTFELPPSVNAAGNAAAATLWRAVLVSVLIHSGILFWWKLPSSAVPMGGKQILSVRIGIPTPPSPATIDGAMLSQPALSSPLVTAVPKPDAVKPDPKPQQPSLQKTAPATAKQTETGSVSSGVLNATKGDTNLLLVINEDGQVQDLIWQELPPLTPEQFESLEQRIRAKRYLATGKTYPLREVIDISRYLNH